VTQLSPRLWRVTGKVGHAYLVTDTARTEAALIDADAADAAQCQALCALAVAPVRWLLFTQAGDAMAAALQAHWPAARPIDTAQPGPPLQLGTDCTLRRAQTGAGTLGYLIEQDRIAVGELAPADPACMGGGYEWLAPRQGFMRHLASAPT